MEDKKTLEASTSPGKTNDSDEAWNQLVQNSEKTKSPKITTNGTKRSSFSIEEFTSPMNPDLQDLEKSTDINLCATEENEAQTSNMSVDDKESGIESKITEPKENSSPGKTSLESTDDLSSSGRGPEEAQITESRETLEVFDTEKSDVQPLEGPVDDQEASLERVGTPSPDGQDKTSSSASQETAEPSTGHVDQSDGPKTDAQQDQQASLKDETKNIPNTDDVDELEGVPDDEYFQALPKDEIEWYKTMGPSLDFLKAATISCTICSKQLTNRGTDKGVRHPVLGVTICNRCRCFYGNEDTWKKDADGLFEFCAWCGQGGDLLICDNCPHGFCKRCLQKHLGRSFLTSAMKSEIFQCLVCDPKPIFKYRATYHALHLMLKGNHEPGPSTTKTTESKKAKPPSDLIEDNINSAFKTLKLYQKALEEEQKRWSKTNSDDPTAASAICKSLRRIYGTTKKNMELLDAALVDSFAKKFSKKNLDLIQVGKAKTKPTLVPKSLKRKIQESPSKSSSPKRAKKLDALKKKPAKANSKKKSQELKVKMSKPRPKSKKTTNESPKKTDVKAVTTPQIKRRPGPKSKTMPRD